MMMTGWKLVVLIVLRYLIDKDARPQAHLGGHWRTIGGPKIAPNL